MSATKRKDNKGRLLKEGESQRKDGRYMFRYADIYGDTQTEYSWRLVETDPFLYGKKKDKSLREKEALIQKDLMDGISTSDGMITLNELFPKYLKTKKRLSESTRNTYTAYYNGHIKSSSLGNKKIKDIKKSDILQFYDDLSEEGLSNGTIRNIHSSILTPTLQLAVEDDSLRKNPCNGCIKEYPYQHYKLRDALTIAEQRSFIEFLRNDNVYSKYLPIVLLILGTGLRRGEVLGLTWNDIDFKAGVLNVDHQLFYRKDRGIFKFGICPPKSEAGKRTIPLMKSVVLLLQEIKRNEYFNSVNSNIVVDGMSDFVFLNNQKNNVLIPRKFGDSIKSASIKYNNRESQLAIEEEREPELLPLITPHVLRHTACTRMAEAGMDIKVLQDIMGHTKPDITMNVYNHVDLHRKTREIERLESSEGSLLLGLQA